MAELIYLSENKSTCKDRNLLFPLLSFNSSSSSRRQTHKCVHFNVEATQQVSLVGTGIIPKARASRVGDSRKTSPLGKEQKKIEFV